MLFIPKKYKYKKLQKGSLFNKINVNINLKTNFVFSIKLIAKSFGVLNNKQLSTVRFILKKAIKKKGYLRFNIFPQQSVTKKPLEVRMGKGKGSVDHWISKIKVGTLICQIFYKKKIKVDICKSLKQIQIRLPFKTSIIL